MVNKNEKFSAVGKRQPRLDGALKASGRAEFTDDVLLPGMLYGKIVRSSIPHGKIINIDTSLAEKLPGVKAVITHRDSGGLMSGSDNLLFCEDIVRFFGDEIAAVAAIDEDTALEAAELIKIDYEPLPPIFSFKEAMGSGAPPLHDFLTDNIADEITMNFGDAEKAFADSEHIREDEFTIQPTHSAFAEHHVVLADFSLADRLTIWTPIQSSSIIKANMARNFGLTDSNVRIVNLNTGGAFCGRGADKPHHSIAAMLSRKAGRPVKIICTADEEFLVYRGGGKYTFKLRTGVMKDGTLMVTDADVLHDCGAYMETQFILLRFLGGNMQALYKMKALRYTGKLIYTNNPPYFFHHGAGLVAMRFALDSQLDLIAGDLGIDPVEIRLRNAMEKGYITPAKYQYASCGLKECIQKSAKQSGWKKKFGRLPPYRGIGIGCGMLRSGGKGMFDHDNSSVFIKLEEDGKVSLFTGLPDMGQGSHTAMAIIAAETLGIQTEDIKVIAGDTDAAPYDVGAISQRGTFTTGNATIQACLDAKRQLTKTAAEKLGVKPSAIVFKDRKVYQKENPGKAVSFEDIVYAALHSDEGRYIMGRGFYNPPCEAADITTGEGNSALAYSFGSQIAEVEVDPETGIVKLLRMTVAHDVGRAINPLAVEGQLDGQVFSGMGQTLFEECIMENGQVLNPTLLDYKLPRPFELPEVAHIIVETNDPYGPYGAKEVGQGPIQCTAQAIANAVSNAIGVPIKELPITPERVLKAIKEKNKT
jgi:4-hydroxybenzoyl-CoA reductase subunit alpha